MLLGIYKAMMQASTPLLDAYLKKRETRGKEDPARAGERRGRAARARGDHPLVWFHAASVGESLSLLAIIARLLDEHPAIDVMVTTGTVTSAKLMADRLPARAFHQYIPVDHPKWVARFLDHWQPDFIIWAESEFWPNMLCAIRARGIPAVLLNARMSEDSFRRWKWAKGAIGAMLGVFDFCLAQNGAEAARLTALGARDVRVSANLKYAASPLPCDEHELATLLAAFHGRNLVLWASTHPGEEEIARDTHLALKPAIPNLTTVIVPRHPVRGAEVRDLCRDKNLSVALRSTGDAPQESDIYVADTLGELGLFFRLCPLVVMGGSFADIGGHNPIEPGQLGCAIFYGPQMYNFITINDDFLAAKAAVQVPDVAALQKQLLDALARPAALDAMRDAARVMTHEKSHILDDLAQLLRPRLAALGAGKQAA